MRTMIDTNKPRTSEEDEDALMMMDCSMTNVLGEEEEDESVFEIIEEISDDEGGEEKKEETFEESISSSNHSNNNESFSLSSIKFALGDALSGSAHSLGSQIGTVAESLKRASLHSAPSPKMADDSNSSHSGSNHSSKTHHQYSSRAKSFVVPSFDGRGLLMGDGGKPRKAPVELGKFERRVRRLKYTNEDVAEIAEDPEQFEELRLALREMGAMTDTTLKLKLHWYIRNSKREKERMRKEAEIMKQQQRQQQEEGFPETPPTEMHVVDSAKVLTSSASPNSVRGIYVPESL